MTARHQLEEILFQCLESEDFDRAVEHACSTHADLSGEIRRLAESVRKQGLLALGEEVPARELGGHELLEKLGEGGMGVIYRALQRSTGREVALKILRPELHFFDKSRARFQREVEAVARLSHPAIVPVFEAGEDQDVPFFTMEYVRGASLATVLHWLRGKDPSTLRGEDVGVAVADISGLPDEGAWDGPFGPRMLRMFVQLAGALVHAHDCGVLHRDLKPSNILLRNDGRAQLLDFGLASLAGSERLSGSGPLGTPAYMAPELLGDRVQIPNPRFDVYGLGLVLYETLTLEQPFVRDGSEATRARILRYEVPALRKRNTQVGWDLEVVCAKAMAREPEERYADIAEFAKDLENVLEDRPIQARRPGIPRLVQRWARRRATPLLAIGSALLVALVASVWLLVRERDVRFQIEEALYRSNITIAAGHLSRGLPDEARAALDECPEHLRGWEWHYHQLLGDATEAVLTRHVKTCVSIDISPDGRRLASCGAKCARITDLQTGRLEHEFKVPNSLKVAFGDDGRYLVVSTAGEKLVIYDARSGALVREVPERAHYLICTGDTLAYGTSSGAVRVVRLSSGEVIETVDAHESEIFGLALSADGSACATGARGRVRLWRFPSFERVGEWKTRYPIISDLCFAGKSDRVLVTSSDIRSGRVVVERFSTDPTVPAWPETPRGTYVAVSRDGENVAVAAASISMRYGADTPFVNVFGNSAPIVDLEFAPDGRKLYAMCSDGSVQRFSSTGSAGYFKLPLGIGVIRRLEAVDSTHVACASSRGQIALVDLRTRRVAVRSKGPGGRIEGLVRTGDSLFVVTREGRWAEYAGTSLERRDGGDVPRNEDANPSTTVRSVARWPDGIAVALSNGEIHVREQKKWSHLGSVEGLKLLVGIEGRRVLAVSETGVVHELGGAAPRSFETGLQGVMAAGYVNDRLWISTTKAQLVAFDPGLAREVLRVGGLRRNVSALFELAGEDRWGYVDWAGDVSLHAPGEVSTLMRVDLTPSMLLAATADREGTWIATAGLAGALYVLTKRRIEMPATTAK